MSILDEKIARLDGTPGAHGVTFPMSEKVEVNGDDRHPVYSELVTTPDEEGRVGDVQWNFEKFLLDADGTVVARFSPGIEPDRAEVRERISSILDRG